MTQKADQGTGKIRKLHPKMYNLLESLDNRRNSLCATSLWSRAFWG
jgi:hypothetical protein